MLYICTTTTKCEILEKNANCKVTLKKLWCRLLRSNSELAWKVKVKQEEKKVWKLLWKTKTCWHPASDLSFSKRCNCDHLEYWFPMGHAIYVPASAAKIVIIWGVQTCYEYQRCSFHFFHGWCYWAFQAHDLLQGMVSDGQHIHNSILISGQSSW